MESATNQTSVYAFLLAALSYAGYGAVLLRSRSAFRTNVPQAARLLAGATAATLLWACLGLAPAIALGVPAPALQLVDTARYGLWFWFLLKLIEPWEGRTFSSPRPILRLTATIVITA